MSRNCGALLGYQGAAIVHWVEAVASVAKAYAGLLDPRPDLSVPARTVRLPYKWWW
jgi:hypothetical protein